MSERTGTGTTFILSMAENESCLRGGVVASWTMRVALGRRASTTSIVSFPFLTRRGCDKAGVLFGGNARAVIASVVITISISPASNLISASPIASRGHQRVCSHPSNAVGAYHAAAAVLPLHLQSQNATAGVSLAATPALPLIVALATAAAATCSVCP